MRKRLLIAVLLILLLTPVAIVAVLLYTQTGVELLAKRTSNLKIGHVSISVEGVTGTLAGPLHIASFELNHPRVHVLVRDITVDVDVSALLRQTILTQTAHAGDALVEVRAAEMPPTNRPPRFLPRFLRLDARGVRLDHVRYVHLNGTTVDANQALGWVTMTSKQLRVRSFQVDAPQFNATGYFNMQASDPLTMDGAASGRVRLSRAEFALRAQIDGALDRLKINAEIQEPSAASVAALFTRPDDQWRIEGDVRSSSFALDPFLEKPPFSLRDIDLDVTASAAGIHTAGTLGIPELDERDLTVDASGSFAARVLRIDAADIALNGTPARLHASGTVAFDGDAPTLDIAAQWRALQYPLAGQALVTSAQGVGTLRGPLPYDFAVSGDVVGPKVPPAQAAANGTLWKDHIVVSAYDVKALEGALQGAASLQFAQPRAWTLSTQAQSINPLALHAEFPGRLNFKSEADGVGLDYRKATFNLHVRDLTGSLRGESVAGSGRIQRQRNSWIARDVDVRFAKARLTLNGTLGERIEARWALHAPALDDLAPNAGGALDFSGSASGARRSPHLVATLRGEKLRYEDWRAERVAIDADIDATSATASRFNVDAAGLGRGAPLLAQLQLRGQGVASDHRISIEATGVAPNSRDAPPRAVMEAVGSYRDERWTATVTTTELTRGDDEDDKLAILEPARVIASRDEALLENLCLAVSAGRLCAQGKWRRGGAWDAMVAGYEIPLAFVLPPSGEEVEYAGRIEGRVRVNGAPDRAWEGDAGMRIIDAAIIHRPPGAKPETLNLGTGGLAATATAERVNFSFGVQAFADTFLYANAELQRKGRNDILNLPLKGDVRARAADANMLPLLFPEIDHAAGVLTANAVVSGSLAAPEINGRIELANGEFDSYRVNLALRELSLSADLENSGLAFRGSGRAGEGRAELNGRFEWLNGETRGDFTLRGRDLLVADLSEYRVVASPDLRFRIDGERMDVAGDVTIPHALVQPNRLTGAVRASDDAIYVGEHAAEREGRFIVHSEVRINMGDDVRIDAFGLQGRITGGVGTTVHTGETPIGRGELGVDGGRYEAYGQELEINRGRLLFDSTPLDDPGLDIEARRIVETTTVGLNVRGTLQEPRLTFFSDPSMPQTQILSYLLTGKSVDAMQSGDAATLRSAQNSLALQGGGLLASQIGRRIGLDEVGVESSVDTSLETNTSLVLGKFLSPRLFISYGISLTESINTLKLRYTISDRWVFKTEAGENQSADVEFTIER